MMISCCKCISVFGILFYVIIELTSGRNGIHHSRSILISQVQTRGQRRFSRRLLRYSLDWTHHCNRYSTLLKKKKQKQRFYGFCGKLLWFRQRKRRQAQGSCIQINSDGRSQNDSTGQQEIITNDAVIMIVFFICVA